MAFIEPGQHRDAWLFRAAEHSVLSAPYPTVKAVSAMGAQQITNVATPAQAPAPQPQPHVWSPFGAPQQSAHPKIH